MKPHKDLLIPPSIILFNPTSQTPLITKQINHPLHTQTSPPPTTTNSPTSQTSQKSTLSHLSP